MVLSEKLIGLISIAFIFILFACAICVLKIINVQNGIFRFLETQRLISRNLLEISKNHQEHRILFEEAARMGFSRDDNNLQQKYSGSIKSFWNSSSHVQKDIAEVQNHGFGFINFKTHDQLKKNFEKFNQKVININNHHSLRISYEQTFFALAETGITREARLKAEAVRLEERYLTEAIADLLKD